MILQAVLTLFFVSLYGGTVSAQIASRDDCAGFANVNPTLWPQTVQQRIKQHDKPSLTIFTDKDLVLSLVYLQNYCCSVSKNSEEHCAKVQKPPRDRFPESPYIVDQLMYLGMKKLDGNQEHCDILGIDCQPRTYDVDPVERREEIAEIAEDTEGYPPSLIFEKFKETWMGSSPNFLDITTLSEMTMAKAYWALCNDIGTLRFVSGLQGGVIEGLVTGGQSLEEVCLQRARDRFTQEQNYVKILQVEKGRQYFTDNLKAYLNDYYIDSRLAGLMGKYATLDSCFQTVMRYVQKTSCCNM